MSLVVKWDDVPEASGYRLYWGTSKFTLSNLPTNKVDISAGVNEYEIVDVKRQTVYWFVIETLTEGNGSIFGQIFPLGYFPDTGPGPSTLLRGTWEFGFFGEVPSSEIANFAEIYVALLNWGVAPPTALNIQDAFSYLKCIVNGKIIFMPAKKIYPGAMDGTAANLSKMGAWANDGKADDTTSPIFNFKDREYQHRLPRASNTKPTGLVTLDVSSDDVLMSEIGMLNALFVSPAETDVSKNPENSGGGTVYLRLGDYAGLDNPFSGHNSSWHSGGGYSTRCYSYNGNGVIGAPVIYNTASYLPVLELLF